ncbi:hypothetical protein [Streptomyces sp. NRRL S-646]|uniref:hypothetical protein n=1 Tax=Streptomyces sp. NRRL S-646 TaxID=1463917 RepID=UPI0004C877EB|nr:hypothetical protein [Streptomyces sp. NRRL S-646]
MTAPPEASPLRRHRPFVLLCAEQTAGSVGRQITALALTLLAVTVLDAGPVAASVILALTYLPGAVLSPVAGMLVDRVRLRRLLVLATSLQQLIAPAGIQGRVAGFNQAALLATVPVGALGGGALAAALGNVPVPVAAAAIALASGATLWAPVRVREHPLPDQAQ